ncbi:MAG TPA: serine/threonine-protein kinase [Candidatus Acidoferrum sp.]|nr:serine/threonine-protein kinase [Candidatus Acidoferrum sp.]
MSLHLATRIRPGTLLDHYRLEHLVASGGTASVFRATDIRTGRTVAVKIPHFGKASDRPPVTGFRQGTGLDRKFDHPGLVKILGDDGAGHRYVVMEWIEGRLLRHLIEERTGLSAERSVHIALEICEVLEYIHGRALAHLDLKPDNIIVGSDDAVKLIDFDIARETRRGLLSLFRPRRMGTPDYASPEQIRGKAGDARSDIYSLGLILYEMLTGEVPFSGVAPLMALKLRLSKDAVPPREINPEVPERLQGIVCCAIARDPAKRYQTAREVSAQLRQVVECGLGELVGSA